jgi:hypothetical protein
MHALTADADSQGIEKEHLWRLRIIRGYGLCGRGFFADALQISVDETIKRYFLEKNRVFPC